MQHMGNRAESGKSKAFSCTWDSLRNSAGEKILQLRSHPLGVPSDSNFCSQLSDLSVEQRFDISYLELGELFFWGISLLFPLELKLIDCQQLNLVLELVSYSSFYFTVATFD